MRLEDAINFEEDSFIACASRALRTGRIDVKTARGNKRILGRCPDFMVMGRPLREWAEGSMGESTADLFALREATCKTTGMKFEEAVGPMMAEEWNKQLAKLRQAEEDADLFGPYREGLRILGHPEAKLGCLFKLPHPKEGLPEAFAAASADGRVFGIGLVGGSWREIDLVAAVEAITSEASARGQTLTGASD